MSKSLGKSCKAIANYLKDPQAYGKRFKGGRPPKLSDTTLRLMFREVSKTGLSSSKIVAQLDLPITSRAVRYKLSSNTIFKFVKRNSAPALTEKHKECEAEFRFGASPQTIPVGQDHLVRREEINLDGPDGLQCYWRDLRQDHETYMSRKFGGKSLMIWGAFSSSGVSELAFLEGNQDAAKYVWTLQDYLMPFGHQFYADEILFQQDNASIHRAKTTMEFLKEQKVTVFDHHALPPDLNSIENLWGRIVRIVYSNGKQYDNVVDLKAAIKRA
ncbi:hypothetical protein AaE_014803 [Aphanomyces astaci]|uniref:Tc1-like transposase DDE domain-containing protein n=1 Tax=Aphanomyces astaci TaxID=112090 RepID=A0A6A4Z1X2_APHAT|nr:hypothetical protein AaE_014803 [Aphanomyces astaci]